MAEAVIGSVIRIKPIFRLHAVHGDIIVVRIGRIKGAVWVERQGLALKLPGGAPVSRSRRDHGLLLIARAIVEIPFEDAAVAPPHERKIIGLHQAEAVIFRDLAVLRAVTRIGCARPYAERRRIWILVARS